MWNKIIFDHAIIIYIMIAGGITELLMRFTSDTRIPRRKFAALSTIIIAIGASLVHKGLNSQAFFKGLIAAGLTSALYDYIKSILVTAVGGKK